MNNAWQQKRGRQKERASLGKKKYRAEDGTLRDTISRFSFSHGPLRSTQVELGSVNGSYKQWPEKLRDRSAQATDEQGLVLTTATSRGESWWRGHHMSCVVVMIVYNLNYDWSEKYCSEVLKRAWHTKKYDFGYAVYDTVKTVVS